MIVMGRVCAPYGVKGWIKVYPYTTEPDRLLEFRAWWIGREADQASWERRTVVQARRHGRALVARLEGIADRESAVRLTGLDIALPRQNLPVPPAGEYYLADLLGLTVVNTKGESLGLVAGFLETGTNLVLKVQAERELLIPFAESVIEAVEVDERRIRVNWDSLEP